MCDNTKVKLSSCCAHQPEAVLIPKTCWQTHAEAAEWVTDCALLQDYAPLPIHIVRKSDGV